MVTVTIPSLTSDATICFDFEDVISDDDLIEYTESFLVVIQQIVPPLTVLSVGTEVFIEDDDGMQKA